MGAIFLTAFSLSLQFLLVIDMPLPPLTNPAQVPEEIKSICIFCGAGTGGDPIYVEHAKGRPIIKVTISFTDFMCPW